MIAVVPKGYKVFVQILPVKGKLSKHGIIIPDDHSEKCRIGKVLAIGDDVTEYEVGEYVLINWLSGQGNIIYLYENGWLDDTNRLLNESEIQCGLTNVEEEDGN